MKAIDKFDLLYNNFEHALETHYPPRDNFELLGMIEYFKIAYEAAWKALRELLIKKGFKREDILTAKQAFQKAKILGLIEDDDEYIQVLQLRNESEYLIDEDVARVLLKRIKRNYAYLLRDINKIMRRELK